MTPDLLDRLLGVVDDLAPNDALAALEQARSHVLVRLVTEARTAAPPPEDRLLSVEDAAAQLGTTPDWLRRHGRRLGLTVQLSPGQCRYSSQAIARFIAHRLGR